MCLSSPGSLPCIRRATSGARVAAWPRSGSVCCSAKADTPQEQLHCREQLAVGNLTL